VVESATVMRHDLPPSRDARRSMIRQDRWPRLLAKTAGQDCRIKTTGRPSPLRTLETSVTAKLWGAAVQNTISTVAAVPMRSAATQLQNQLRAREQSTPTFGAMAACLPRGGRG
jgi:hypothetical protein